MSNVNEDPTPIFAVVLVSTTRESRMELVRRAEEIT